MRGESDILYRVLQFRWHVWSVSTIKKNLKKRLNAIEEGRGAKRAVDGCPQCCVWLPNFPTLKFEMKNPKRYKFLLTLALCPLRAAEGHLVRRNRMQTVVLFESDAE